MINKVFKWFIDRLLPGLISIFIAAYLNLPDDKKDNFFSFEWFQSILQVDIPLWQVLLIFGFLITFFLTQNWWRERKSNQESANLVPPDLPHLKYKVDNFGTNKAKWTWDYEWSPSKEKYFIKNILPLCPVCNSKMRLAGINKHMMYCSRCNLEGKKSFFDLKQFSGDIGEEIIRRIESGVWKSHIN